MPILPESSTRKTKSETKENCFYKRDRRQLHSSFAKLLRLFVSVDTSEQKKLKRFRFYFYL